MRDNEFTAKVGHSVSISVVAFEVNIGHRLNEALLAIMHLSQVMPQHVCHLVRDDSKEESNELASLSALRWR
jgi:hypothetical protein